MQFTACLSWQIFCCNRWIKLIAWLPDMLSFLTLSQWACHTLPVKCHITGPVRIKIDVWPHVDCVWWILWLNKSQINKALSCVQLMSIFGNLVYLEIKIVYLPSVSLGPFLLNYWWKTDLHTYKYLHPKSKIAGFRVFWRGQHVKVCPLGAPLGSNQ